LRPVTDQVRDISAELRAFSEAGDPALASLQPVLERGTAMLHEAAPLVRDLRPGGTGLRGASKAGRALAEDALGDRLADLMEFMKGWSLATSDYDAVSHYFKAILPLSPSPLGRGVTGPVGVAPEDPLGGLPVPTPPRPDLPGRTGGDSSAGRDAAAERGADGAPDGSATGLTPGQEGQMLDQLLGGN
jgi:phospholipid/cholesterol/gamma-HCH transport system substrate-binding protein